MNGEVKAFVKIQNIFFFLGGGGGGGRVGGGGQGGCERRSEAFVKIQTKNILFYFFGEGGCRIGGGGGGRGHRVGDGVRVDVNGEVKFL